MLGRSAFQAAAAGSYSPSDFIMNFTLINILAILLILIGGITGYKIYQKGMDKIKVVSF